MYSTSFASGGFDLIGVGVINRKTILSNTDFNADSLNLYPNPTTDMVHFSIEKECSVIVYDLSGKIVKNLPNANYKEIVVSDLNLGTYLFTISAEGRKIVKRILVK